MDFLEKDIFLWQDSLEENGIIAFHDYGWPGVARAIKELIAKSNGFIVHRTRGGLLYASKGNPGNKNLLLRLQKLESMREKFRTVWK